MTVDPRPRWSPLPADGEWTTGPSWEEVTSLLADSAAARRAVEALRKMFPPEWVRSLEGTQLHPLEFDYFQRAVRVDLIELGLALAALRPRRVDTRLRNRLEYRTTRAELQAGLMLHLMGATVEHEPTGKATGPDWAATWPSGRIGVEVKCMATSANAEALMMVSHYFIEAFSAALEDVRPSEAAWLNIHLAAELVDELVFARTRPSVPKIEALARDAAAVARAALGHPTVAGTFSMGRAGTFEIALGLGGEPRFQFAGPGICRDDAHEFGRLYDEVRRAAGQLRAISLPGVVILDMGRDGLLTNHYGSLQAVLETESWATDLAGAVFVDRHAAGGGRSHTLLHVVPGKLIDALADTFGPSVVVCDAGHRHALSLLRPTGEPCDCRP